MFFPSLVQWNTVNILIRIVAALLLGAIVGLDRGLKRRGAGAKTCTVLCLGATLVMLTAQYMEVYFPDKADMARLAAQVISGIGFLGVGTIIITGNRQVKGLTTAASLWTCACIGLACGIGFVDGALIITICVLFALHILASIETVLYKNSKYVSLIVEVSHDCSIARLIASIKELNITVNDTDFLKNKKDKTITIFLSIKASQKEKEQILDTLTKNTEVYYIEEV